MFLRMGTLVLLTPTLTPVMGYFWPATMDRPARAETRREKRNNMVSVVCSCATKRVSLINCCSGCYRCEEHHRGGGRAAEVIPTRDHRPGAS